MYFLYIDESGDPGSYTLGSSANSRHFILSGIIVKDEDWKNTLVKIQNVRKELKLKHNFLLKYEIHTSELIRVNKTEYLKKFKKTERINILKFYVAGITNSLNQSSIINVCLDKTKFDQNVDFQELAWKRIIQRYENFLIKKSSLGIIISDFTDENKLRGIIRKMRINNYIPSTYQPQINNQPIQHIIEDLFMRDSLHSYFIQCADTVSHLLYRKEFPKSSLKKFGIDLLFNQFQANLLKEAAKNDKFGIVRK